MLNVFLGDKIEALEIDADIIKKLNSNNINTISDLWDLKRKELKKIELNDVQINEVIVKMQLIGIDLNKKIYDKN